MHSVALLYIAADGNGDPQISTEGQACRDCHSNSTSAILEPWHDSAPARKNGDCFASQRANEKDPAAFDHYGHRIAVTVTRPTAPAATAKRWSSSKEAIMLRQRNSSRPWTTGLGSLSKEGQPPSMDAANATAAK
jgi:hypothetical protein